MDHLLSTYRKSLETQDPFPGLAGRLDGSFWQKMAIYLGLAKKWNYFSGLYGRIGGINLISLLLTDGLALAEAQARFGFEVRRWLDIGSGNGAPAVVYACLNPATTGLLWEPKRKKHSFLQAVKVELGLKGIMVEEHRLDRKTAQTPQLQGAFDLLFSRATMAWQEWMPLAWPLVQQHGFLCGFASTKENPQQITIKKAEEEQYVTIQYMLEYPNPATGQMLHIFLVEKN